MKSTDYRQKPLKKTLLMPTVNLFILTPCLYTPSFLPLLRITLFSLHNLFIFFT